MTKRLAVLLSGRGSNFLAIHEAIVREKLPAEIAVVISNRAAAPGLEKARELGLRSVFLDERDFGSREAHEAEVIRAIDDTRAALVVLAGYMRLLSPSFVERFAERILNIHPSLLPAFPGVNAQRQALEHGVKITGCTVHFVDSGLDNGPIVLQRAVEIRDDDSPETLAARILAEEHIAYPEAIRRICEGAWRVDGRRVVFER